MLLEVILVNFNELILKITQVIMIITMTMTMCVILSCKLSPATTCRDAGIKNNVRIIGTIWELKRKIRNFLGSAGKNNR